MSDADRLLAYLSAKRALMMAALAYCDHPSEGQSYALHVSARLFAKARRMMKIETPISEEP